MIVSNALPIQFWAVDDETYNEEQICGVEPRCWCAPWQCDDEIKLQINTTDPEDPEEFSFVVIDKDGVVVFQPDGFDAFGQSSLIPEDEGICDGEYAIIIYDPNSPDIQIFEQPDEGWNNIVGAWTFTATYMEIDSSTASVAQDLEVPNGTVVHLTGTVTVQDVGSGPFTSSGVIAFAIQDDMGGNIVLQEFDMAQSGGTLLTTPIDITFQIPDDWPNPVDRLVFGFSLVGFNPRVRFTPNNIGGIIYIPNSAGRFKSDCLDIRASQECTELVTYSNNKDFAGLRYSGITPLPEFSLRVPVVFFHESFPQEEEVHPKSDDTWIRLSSRMERKKLFDIGYVPYYFHQKIQLVLMHDNIEILGEQWKKRDAYNIEEAHKRYPKPKANVLLTDKNFIIRNLI